jgi:hypothetical protein
MVYIPPDSTTKYSPNGNASAPSWRKRQGRYMDPLQNTGRPSHMSAQDWVSSWGELGFHDYPERDAVQPDIRNYVFPSGLGRGWSGRQQLNGVSQLEPGYMVPRRVEYRDRNGKVISGAAPLPYWQTSQAHVNQPLISRMGGAAGEVPGPIQTNAWHDALYAGVPETGGPTGGPGTFSVVANLRSKFGF